MRHGTLILAPKLQSVILSAEPDICICMYWPWRGNINRREVKELTFICCGLPLSGAGLHTLCWNTTVSPLSCQRPHLTWLEPLFSVCVGMAMLAAPRAPCSASFLPDEARMCPKLPSPSLCYSQPLCLGQLRACCPLLLPELQLRHRGWENLGASASKKPGLARRAVSFTQRDGAAISLPVPPLNSARL